MRANGRAGGRDQRFADDAERMRGRRTGLLFRAGDGSDHESVPQAPELVEHEEDPHRAWRGPVSTAPRPTRTAGLTSVLRVRGDAHRERNEVPYHERERASQHHPRDLGEKLAGDEGELVRSEGCQCPVTAMTMAELAHPVVHLGGLLTGFEEHARVDEARLDLVDSGSADRG